MNPSNFTFLQAEWPDVHEAAVQAETRAYSDAKSACFYARRTLELTVLDAIFAFLQNRAFKGAL
jgi:hypothetical protein